MSESANALVEHVILKVDEEAITDFHASHGEERKCL